MPIIKKSFVNLVEESLHVPAHTHMQLYCLQMGSRGHLTVSLDGEGAQADIQVAYLSDTQHANDFTCEVYHKASQTISHQNIVGGAAQAGQAHINSLIHIQEGMARCEGYQQHKGLLLSPDALISCVPELNIYAEDVICTHGSAIGALDKLALFYMCSRGLSEQEAKKMLLLGFFDIGFEEEALQQIEKWIESYV